MSKYYTLEIRKPRGICWYERDGRKLKNDYGLELYVERRSMKNFVVTEAHSGGKLGEGSLRRLAIANFEKLVVERGIDEIRKRIQQCIGTHGVSPLFTDKPKYPIVALKKEVID